MDELRRHFALVDASFCFVARNQAAPSVRSILRIANSFGSSQLTRQNLVDLAAIAPDLLILSKPTSSSQSRIDDLYSPKILNNEDLEVVTFPLAPQTSQHASLNRKKIFDAALSEYFNRKVHFVSTQKSVETQKSSIQTSKPKKKERGVPAFCDWGSSILRILQQMEFYSNQIVHVEQRQSHEAQYRDLDPLHLSPRVSEILGKCYNIQQLYSHQFEAIQAIFHGENVVLSTATASGKSLAYNIPMLQMLLEDASATFMYLFPTKALAQDQLKSLRRLLETAEQPLHLGATFDGDTPMRARSMVIRETRIFLTNPDMLHLTILPQHRQWKQVLANLRFLVVDEAHMYRGVFGSHVACVFRRLFRLCAFYGSNPQVVACSATIQNPEAHFRHLIAQLPPLNDSGPPNFHFFHQRSLKVITKDGAPKAEKLFCIWNPQLSKIETVSDTKKNEKTELDASPNSTRPRLSLNRKRKRPQIPPNEEESSSCQGNVSSSAIFQGSRILARLVESKIATLVFCRSRKLTELVLLNVHSMLKSNPKTQHFARQVCSYRGGYTFEARRRIETQLFHGELLGVVATNALEVGIDIGELECTIHLGLPSSIASLWQQAGRAGRRHDKAAASVAIIVCFNAPLDQHFALPHHATELFQREPEAVTLNAMNPRILGQHLVCAARESALYSKQSGTSYIDSYVFGKLDGGMKKVVEPLVKEKKLLPSVEAENCVSYRLHSCIPKKSRAVSLRSICEETYTVMVLDEEKELDEIPGDRAFFQVYPTAVYLHQGQEYVVNRVDPIERVACVTKCLQPLGYFTTCRDYTDLDVVRIHSTSPLEKGVENDAVLVCVGTVSIVTRVFGATMLEKRTMRVLRTTEFVLPPMQSFGDAVWLEFPAALRHQVEVKGGRSWTAALHGVGHVFVALIRLFILCDAQDVGTEHVNEFEQRVKPNRVTIFERRDGGCGLVPEIVKVLPKLIAKSWTLLSECKCSKGCPACIQSTECSEYNLVLDKQGSLEVLSYLYEIVKKSG